MTEAFSDINSARARIQGQLAEARARTAVIEVLADEVTTTTATVRSPRGEVSVTSTASSIITDVTVSDDALDLHPDALGRVLRDTIAAAQRAAARLALEAAEESLGADNGFVAELRADVDSRFTDLPGETTLR